MSIRPLVNADLPALLVLSNTAGWNQLEDDWLRLLRLQPDGCFGIDIGNTLAASATVIEYGLDLAWIGMVLTLPDFRGQGLARRLMERCLEFSSARTVKLDASDMGKHLYETLGFRDECAIERWVRPAGAPEQSAGTPLQAREIVAAYDAEVFGADRSDLLTELQRYETAALSDRSYALARPGRLFHYFGPCVADDAAEFATLLEWCVARHGHEGQIALDLFPHAAAAVEVARRFGFEPVRRLWRMVREPAPPELPDPRIYAIAGFEFG